MANVVVVQQGTDWWTVGIGLAGALLGALVGSWTAGRTARKGAAEAFERELDARKLDRLDAAVTECAERVGQVRICVAEGSWHKREGFGAYQALLTSAGLVVMRAGREHSHLANVMATLPMELHEAISSMSEAAPTKGNEAALDTLTAMSAFLQRWVLDPDAFREEEPSIEFIRDLSRGSTRP